MFSRPVKQLCVNSNKLKTIATKSHGLHSSKILLSHTTSIFIRLDHYMSTISAPTTAVDNNNINNQIQHGGISGKMAAGECASVSGVLENLDLYNHKEAYRSKRMRDILRAYVIIRMCSVDFLVRHQFKLLKVSRRLLGKHMFNALMRRTIYAQFMAGENREQVLQNITRVSRYGVLPLLGFTANEAHGNTASIAKQQSAEEMFAANIQGMKDSFSIGHDCTALVDDIVKGTRARCTGKLTFLRPHQSLITTTSLIEHNTDLVKEYITGSAIFDTGPLANDIKKIAKKHSFTKDGKLDVDGLLLTTEFHFDLYEALKDKPEYSLNLGDDYVESKREIRLFGKILSELAEEAVAKGVCLLWDAEQTYLQKAIDALVMEQMRKHNKERVVVYNTYQCYLKKTYDNIRRDAGVAEREGFKFGAKVVRGAYIDEERRLAAEKGYEDPINDNYEATTASYYRVADFLIGQLSNRPRGDLHVIFGSHNDQTILYLLERMKNKGLPADREMFWLAQVYGLKDYIAFPLAQAGVPAGKLMQYGAIESGVAYMSRRVLENKHGLDTASGRQECQLLSKEIRRRMLRRA